MGLVLFSLQFLMWTEFSFPDLLPNIPASGFGRQALMNFYLPGPWIFSTVPLLYWKNLIFLTTGTLRKSTFLSVSVGPMVDACPVQVLCMYISLEASYIL